MGRLIGSVIRVLDTTAKNGVPDAVRGGHAAPSFGTRANGWTYNGRGLNPRTLSARPTDGTNGPRFFEA